MENGYILLHRKMISEWEWYNNINDTRLWVHCLLKANWKKGFFEGHEIKRGSFVSSYEKLAIETGLTFSQIRKSLEHLKKSKNITITRHSRFSIITITNYEKYQIEKQTDDKHLTITSQSFSNNIINNNKEKEYKEKYKKESLPDWFDKDFVKDETNLKEMEEVLSDFK